MKKTKVCKRCGKRKRIGSFNRQRACKDGLAVWCKLCYKEYNAARYQTNRVELAKKGLEKYYARKAKENGSE